MSAGPGVDSASKNTHLAELTSGGLRTGDPVSLLAVNQGLRLATLIPWLMAPSIFKASTVISLNISDSDSSGLMITFGPPR